METEQIAYFDKLIQQKLENLPRAIEGKSPIERLEKICRELRWLKEAKEQLSISRVVGSLPASKEEALRKRKILADKYYRNDFCESAFALGFINCYEWLERIIKK